jgi:hypothetical protein
MEDLDVPGVVHGVGQAKAVDVLQRAICQHDRERAVRVVDVARRRAADDFLRLLPVTVVGVGAGGAAEDGAGQAVRLVVARGVGPVGGQVTIRVDGVGWAVDRLDLVGLVVGVGGRCNAPRRAEPVTDATTLLPTRHGRIDDPPIPRMAERSYAPRWDDVSDV